VQRSIVGFHQDDVGDWVAELSCLHGQHVRHRPPFYDRPWVVNERERAARIGADLECPLCDRAEMPEGLTLVRCAGPFTAETTPAALRTRHRVADGTWGCLRVLEGSLWFAMERHSPFEVCVAAGARQAIPPGMPHSLRLEGPVRFSIEFFVATTGASSAADGPETALGHPGQA
jgi:tellurite methyltransferase